MNRPLVYLALAFAAGIWSTGLFALPVRISLLLCALFLAAAAVGYFFHLHDKCVRGMVLCLFFCLGFFQAGLATFNLQSTGISAYTGHYVTLEGVVSAEADLRENGAYYRLDVRRLIRGKEDRPLSAAVLVRAPAAAPVYAYGDYLRLSGLLMRPADAGNPGEFDYRAYLARRGVGALLVIRDAAAVQKLGTGGNRVMRSLLQLKERMLNVSRATLPPEQAALLNGIVFGTQGRIDRATWRLCSETGVVHILSVSGLHVGLVLGGVLALAAALRLPGSVAMPTAAAALIGYAVLSGLGPAVTRATVMALMLLLARRLGREGDWPTTLAAAALICLVQNPLSLYDIGFQLSFAATWGILYLGPPLDKYLARWRLPASLRAALWVSLAAQLATLPLVARYYNLISPVSLAANLAAVPLTGLILALGGAACTAGLLMPPLAGIINAGTALCLQLFLGIIALMHRLPGAVIFVPTPPPVLVAAWYLVLYAGVYLSAAGGREALRGFCNRRRRLLPALFLAAGLLAAVFLFKSPGENLLEVHFIDVGQGDGIFIHTPGGRNMLVDAGGWTGELATGEGAGDRVVVPYLRRLGVRRLDVLVITHPHEDHAGGVKAVLRSFPVTLAVVSPLMEEAAAGAAPNSTINTPAAGSRVSSGSNAAVLPAGNGNRAGPGRNADDVPPACAGLLADFAARGVPVKTVSAGDRLRLDPAVRIDVLGPPRPLLRGTRSDANNASVVLRLSYGGQSILLTGDIEVEAQRALLAGGDLPAATVLKMPHHGSRYLAAEFLDAVRPLVTVISVGRSNNFAQPSPETLDLLERTPARIYRTDLDGAVILTTDGRRLRVRTGREREAGPDL